MVRERSGPPALHITLPGEHPRIRRVLSESHKLIHTDDKTYKCNVYGISFARKGCLTVHIKIHSEERRINVKCVAKNFIRIDI